MITRYDATLNGISLATIHPDIWVQDIRHTQAAPKNEVYSVAKRQGSRIYRRNYDKASVQIYFEIHNYSTMIRQEICKSVMHWARKGGVLQTSDRSGQRLICVCDTFPSISSALRWTEPLLVTFSAYTLPFWQEVNPSMVSMTGTSGNGNLYVPGVVEDAPVEVDVKAKAKITTLSLTTGTKTMQFSGLNVASGNTIKIAYDDEQILSIKVGSTSLLDKRTGADDLLVDCGEISPVSFTSNANADVVFKARGLWL